MSKTDEGAIRALVLDDREIRTAVSFEALRQREDIPVTIRGSGTEPVEGVAVASIVLTVKCITRLVVKMTGSSSSSTAIFERSTARCVMITQLDAYDFAIVSTIMLHAQFSWLNLKEDG